MADGELTLKLTLSEAVLRRLRERAKKHGVSVDATVQFLVEQQMFDSADWNWGEALQDNPRTAVAELFDPSEPTYSHEEVMAEFKAELEKRLAAKR
jgi:hypothetical protein